MVIVALGITAIVVMYAFAANASVTQPQQQAAPLPDVTFSSDPQEGVISSGDTSNNWFNNMFNSISGNKLSPSDIAIYAANAGFTGDDLVTAVAIAMAESGGNVNAKGDINLAPTNGPSIGLWQINTGSHAHPELASVDLTDPQTNANYAFQIYSVHGNFRPWSTYIHANYLNYYADALQGVNDAGLANG